MMHTPRCGRPYHARTGITVRLPADVRDRVQHIATAEHRSIAGYVQSLIERDLRARDEAERIIHVFAELQDELAGTLVREAGETEDRYSRRAEILRTLLDGH